MAILAPPLPRLFVDMCYTASQRITTSVVLFFSPTTNVARYLPLARGGRMRATLHSALALPCLALRSRIP